MAYVILNTYLRIFRNNFLHMSDTYYQIDINFQKFQIPTWHRIVLRFQNSRFQILESGTLQLRPCLVTSRVELKISIRLLKKITTAH